VYIGLPIKVTRRRTTYLYDIYGGNFTSEKKLAEYKERKIYKRREAAILASLKVVR
jgi:hypothetical protein